MRKAFLSLAFAASTLLASPSVQAGGYDGARDSDNRPHGWGVYMYPGGGRYEGQWQFGEKAGRGIREWRDGSRYDGQWQHNVPHGKGVMTQADGTMYRGDFKAGKRSGRGVETLADGSVYTGEFRADQRHGSGVLVSADGSRHEGQWVHGQSREALKVAAAPIPAVHPEPAHSKTASTPLRSLSPVPSSTRAVAAAAVLPPVMTVIADALPVPAVPAPVVPVAMASESVLPVDVAVEPTAPVATAPTLAQQLEAQGSGVFFTHDLPALSLAGQATFGWWRKSVALFGGGLEFTVAKGSETMHILIHRYHGTGEYAAGDFVVRLSTPSGRFESRDNDGASLTIDSDEDGWIAGRFAGIALSGGADATADAHLTEGVFRLADRKPEIASALGDY